MDLKRILVGTDFSRNSETALKVCLEWAKVFGFSLDVVNAHDLTSNIEPLIPFESQYFNLLQEELLEKGKKDLLAQIEKWNKDGIEVKSEVVVGKAEKVLGEKTSDGHHQILALGSQGHSGYENFLLGSNTEKLIKLSPIPVLAIRNERACHPKKIMLLLDLSDPGSISVKWAEIFAQKFGAELNLTYVVCPTTHLKGMEPEDLTEMFSLKDILKKGREVAQEEMGLIQEELLAKGIKVTTTIKETIETVPTDAILEIKESYDPDLILMGTHGYSGLKKWFLGSCAEILIERTDCSLFIIKE
jgi:nucleotide-binding universal stress UspA family protein